MVCLSVLFNFNFNLSSFSASECGIYYHTDGTRLLLLPFLLVHDPPFNPEANRIRLRGKKGEGAGGLLES